MTEMTEEEDDAKVRAILERIFTDDTPLRYRFLLWLGRMHCKVFAHEMGDDRQFCWWCCVDLDGGLMLMEPRWRFRLSMRWMRLRRDIRQFFCRHRDVEHWGWYDKWNHEGDEGYSCKTCGKEMR